jgi:streptogramin lyase
MKTRTLLMLAVTQIVAACSGGGGHGGGDASPATTAIIATRAPDYSSGALSLVDIASFTAQNEQHPGASSDIKVRAAGDHYFVVSAFETNTITRYDAATPGVATYSYSTNDSQGQNSNPYDIVVASDRKAYVLRYGSGALWIVDPAAAREGAFKTGEIDLSSYDSDGVPEMSAGLIHDGKLYVALQRLQNFAATQNGMIVVIDLNTDAVTATIELPVRDPLRISAVPGSDELLVVADGGYDGWFGQQYEGGIVRIDTDNNSVAMLVDDGDASTHPYGNFQDVVAVDPHRAYAIGSTGYFGTQTLYRLDPDGDAATTPTAVSGFGDLDLGALAVDPTGLLWITRTSDSAPGISVLGYANDAESIIKDLIDTNLTPINIDFANL